MLSCLAVNEFRGAAMVLILFTCVVTLLLFIYLVAALLRPEWF